MAYIPVGLPSTRRGLRRARTAWSAAAAGTAAPGAAGRRAAATRATGTTRMVCGLYWPQVSREQEGSGGAARSRRGGARDERRSAFALAENALASACFNGMMSLRMQPLRSGRNNSASSAAQ